MKNNLFTFSLEGNLEELENLFKNDADKFLNNLNKKEDVGYTPLAIAVARGHVNVVKFLLEKGADVNTQDEKGNTPLHYAGEYNYIEIAKLLLEKNADLNVENKFGNQPLWVAVFSATDGNIDKLPLVKLLISHGANPDHKNKAGNSPYEFANKVGVENVITLLKTN